MSHSSLTSRRLLLIGWDAADWSILHPLLDDGKLPALSRLVEAGVSGRLLCAEPTIGPAQWVSLATGKRPWQHGVCHSKELTRAGQGCRPATAASRRSRALWEILASQGKKCVVVGWPASHGTASGNSLVVSDAFPVPTAGPGIKPWPAPPSGTYWPANLGKRLDPLRVSPDDIQADVIGRYLPQWQKINQQMDQRLGQLRVFLAADFSIFAAFLELIKREQWDFASVRLPALAQIARWFLPYHPPKHPSVGELDFILYGEVLRSACRMLDSLLKQLIQMTGPQTATVVVSGHGLRAGGISSHGPPPEEAEIWKSPYGVFAASGPGIAKDALLHGATVLDVAPTLLTWFGLPIGDDMEGRVLVESFASPPNISRVSSWDSFFKAESAGLEDRFPTSAINASMNLASPPSLKTEQMALAAFDVSTGMAVRAWRDEWDWNFVCSCLEAGQFELAMPMLTRLFQEFPERPDLAQTLFGCQLELKHLVEASQTLAVLLETMQPGAATLILRADLAWAQRHHGLAHSLVQEAQRLNPTDTGILRRIGILLLRLREWDALAQLAQQGIGHNDQDPIAWLALAAAQLRKGQAPQAAEAALRAIGLKYFLPDAHFILVRALVAQGHWPQARDAMQALLKMQPQNRAAAEYSRRISDRENLVSTGSP